MLNKLIGKPLITAAAVVCAFATLGATSAVANAGDAAGNAAPDTTQAVTLKPILGPKTFTRVNCWNELLDKPWDNSIPPIPGKEVFSGGIATITINNSDLNLPAEPAPDCLIRDVRIKMSPLNQSGQTAATVKKQSSGLGRITINRLKMKAQITATYDGRKGSCVTRAPHIVLNLTSDPKGDPTSYLALHGQDYNNTTRQAVLVSKRIVSPKIVPDPNTPLPDNKYVCGFINTNFTYFKTDRIGFSWEVEANPALW